MKLIRELRRREVFRTAGLYIGIAWLTIEASSVLLPEGVVDMERNLPRNQTRLLTATAAI